MGPDLGRWDEHTPWFTSREETLIIIIIIIEKGNQYEQNSRQGLEGRKLANRVLRP